MSVYDFYGVIVEENSKSVTVLKTIRVLGIQGDYYSFVSDSLRNKLREYLFNKHSGLYLYSESFFGYIYKSRVEDKRYYICVQGICSDELTDYNMAIEIDNRKQLGIYRVFGKDIIEMYEYVYSLLGSDVIYALNDRIVTGLCTIVIRKLSDFEDYSDKIAKELLLGKDYHESLFIL